MAGLSTRTHAFPPTILARHLTKSLTASEAQPLLSAYLEDARQNPYLHPDAWLYTEGVKFGPKSGSSGGWAIHHLKRIEAGLRGETLAAESKEELFAKFGEEVPGANGFPRSDGGTAQVLPDVNALKEGDDSQVDRVIEQKTAHDEDESKVAKKRRKQEKKERTEREMASKKRTLNDSNTTDLQLATGGAHAPDQDAMVSDGNEWQSKEDFEREQPILEGDVGARDPANGKQKKAAPVVVSHDVDGEVVVPKKKFKSAEEKAARKAAKRARRQEQFNA